MRFRSPAPAILTAVLVACAGGDPTPPAAPYRGPAAPPATVPLRAVAVRSEIVVTHPDSFVVEFRLRNQGRDTTWGDSPGDWIFRVFTPDGREIERTVTMTVFGSTGFEPVRLAPGDTGEIRAVYLACHEAPLLAFGAQYPDRDPDCNGWKLTEAGDYYVLVQHHMLDPPSLDGAPPVVRRSAADTVRIRFRPAVNDDSRSR